jgi:hypothetical protein
MEVIVPDKHGEHIALPHHRVVQPSIPPRRADHPPIETRRPHRGKVVDPSGEYL